MPERPLYFMIKPPQEVATLLASLLPNSRVKAPNLHVTLLPIGDRRLLPHGAVDALRAIGDRISASPFHVVFDELVGNGRILALVGSERIAGLAAFQTLLAQTAVATGFPIPRYRFHPHITLDYQSPMRGRRPGR